MDSERSAIKTRMITRGIFRLQVQRGSDIVPQVLTAYSVNDTLHTLEMKVKFKVEKEHGGGGLGRELVGWSLESSTWKGI